VPSRDFSHEWFTLYRFNTYISIFEARSDEIWPIEFQQRKLRKEPGNW
jgi:hypothetical protein